LAVEECEENGSDGPYVCGVVEEIVVTGMRGDDAYRGTGCADAIELADHAEEMEVAAPMCSGE
jgi:hypothetical protein